MSRPSLKGRSENRRDEVAGNGPALEIRFTRLEDIPIENAQHEREIFERGEDAQQLNPERCVGPVVVSTETRARRIIEVYRRCFEEADQNARLKVVSDFVAHFPQHAFDADWLKEQLREPMMLARLGNAGREKILSAVANGFRRAGKGRKEPAIQKSYRISGARIAARGLQDELSKWNDSLERHICTPEEIAVRAAEKADELVKKMEIGPVAKSCA